MFLRGLEFKNPAGNGGIFLFVWKRGKCMDSWKLREGRSGLSELLYGAIAE